MRILLVVDSYSKYNSGGLVAHRTVDILKHAGYVIGVFCSGIVDTTQQSDTNVIYYHKYSKSNALKHIWAGEEVREFRKIVKEFRPDVVHFCAFQYGKSRYLISHALDYGARVVLQPWTHDYFCEQKYDYLLGQACGLCASGNFPNALFNRCGNLKSLFIHVLSRYLLRRTALNCHAVLSTNSTMDESLKKYGYSTDKIKRVFLPFDPRRVNELKVFDGKDFIFYGQLGYFKGAHLLQGIVESCPTVSFSIYPPVNSESQLGEYSLDRNKFNNISLDIGLRWFSGLSERLAACRGVLLPSLWPTTPEYVLLEAMGLSKPIVAFDVGAHKDILVDGKNAMLVPSGNVQAFTSAILELDNNAELRQKIGSGARQTFEKLTNKELLLNNLIKTYFHNLSDL